MKEFIIANQWISSEYSLLNRLVLTKISSFFIFHKKKITVLQKEPNGNKLNKKIQWIVDCHQ